MRLLLIPFLLLLIVMIPSSGEEARPLLGRHANMQILPVRLDPADPTRNKFGPLTYLGGLRLRSRDPAFGGFSAMLVRGDHFTLLSDTGNFIRFRMGDDLRPFALAFGDLPAGPKRGWEKGSRDSESMAGATPRGDIWVGFESTNQIWRYDGKLTRPIGAARPEAMRRWDVNGGAESMARLPNGAFIVISETTPARAGIEGHAAVYFDGDPADPDTPSFQFGFRPPVDGYDPSDMAVLPDGRLLVLVRRISLNRWFESKLVLLDPRNIRPGVSVAGRELAAITVPLLRDNFEALAVTQERGRLVIWLASDDNLAAIQQSLLMKFRLDLPGEPPAPRVAPAKAGTAN